MLSRRMSQNGERQKVSEKTDAIVQRASDDQTQRRIHATQGGLRDAVTTTEVAYVRRKRGTPPPTPSRRDTRGVLHPPTCTAGAAAAEAGATVAE